MESIDWNAVKAGVTFTAFALVLLVQAIAGFVYLERTRSACNEQPYRGVTRMTISAVLSFAVLFGLGAWFALVQESPDPSIQSPTSSIGVPV